MFNPKKHHCLLVLNGHALSFRHDINPPRAKTRQTSSESEEVEQQLEAENLKGRQVRILPECKQPPGH
jgi:5'-3' exonuclease